MLHRTVSMCFGYLASGPEVRNGKNLDEGSLSPYHRRAKPLGPRRADGRLSEWPLAFLPHQPQIARVGWLVMFFGLVASSTRCLEFVSVSVAFLFLA